MRCQSSLHWPAGADHWRRLESSLGRLFGLALAVDEPPVANRLGDELFDLIDVKRFFNIVERAVAHRLDGRTDRGVGGDP